MKTLNDLLARLAPPRWLMPLAAALLAALLLALFVDTVEEHLRRSAEWRESRGAAVKSPAVTTTLQSTVVTAQAR